MRSHSKARLEESSAQAYNDCEGSVVTPAFALTNLYLLSSTTPLSSIQHIREQPIRLLSTSGSTIQFILRTDNIKHVWPEDIFLEELAERLYES